MTPLKFCKDCKWYRADDLENNPIWARCYQPDVMKQSIDTNDSLLTYLVNAQGSEQMCTIARQYDRFCGKDARYWEPKEVKEPMLSAWKQIIEYLKALYR